MSEIFLSASIPVVGRGTFHETANPFLIQCAVRELFLSVIRQHVVVWGGHPSITPMIWSLCEDLGVDYSSSVVLYQSHHFQDRFPEENARFQNVVHTPDIPGDRLASLALMREQMLSRPGLRAAVFIGGMDGVKIEQDMFHHLHPDGLVLAVGSTGGAALELARDTLSAPAEELTTVDYASLFRRHLVALDLKVP